MMTKRQQQAMATRQKILDTAERLLAEHRNLEVTVDEIICEVGIGKGTFYHYFPSKDELLFTIIRMNYEKMEKVFWSEAWQGTYIDKLRGFLRDWYRCMLWFDRPFSANHSEFLVDLGRQSSAVSQVSLWDSGIEILRKCLQYAVDEGELTRDCPIEKVSLRIMFNLHGSMLQYNKFDVRFDIREWSEYFVTEVLDLILAPWRNS